MVNRSNVLIALLVVIAGACSVMTSRDDNEVIGSGSGPGSGPGSNPPPMIDAGTPADTTPPGDTGSGSDGSTGGQCAVFGAPVESEGGTPIALSDECVTAACEPDAVCTITHTDAGVIFKRPVITNADPPEIVGSIVVVTKQGAPADVSVTIVDTAKGKNVASKKVEKNATDAMIRTDVDIAGLDMAAIDGVGKKGYKVKIGKPGMLYLGGNKAKRYIEVEITDEVDPNIIVP